MHPNTLVCGYDVVAHSGIFFLVLGFDVQMLQSRLQVLALGKITVLLVLVFFVHCNAFARRQVMRDAGGFGINVHDEENGHRNQRQHSRRGIHALLHEQKAHESELRNNL